MLPEEEIYIQVKIGKFTGLPVDGVHVVVFFKNRKEPFIGYYHMGEWYDETGYQTKTPLYWLKKTMIAEQPFQAADKDKEIERLKNLLKYNFDGNGAEWQTFKKENGL